ncbi:helix-turn-helix transcriptional regulator [Burkholderia sp. Ax-1724]|uniref:helix-turn-helix domain-containing protein n=1 Tax=Burkholderia sp. Ax-1724 TaxID=2608336 RepID=UPI00141EE349|nr:helix-turn-helix transcriptional regulator [Burkholderia sp. Ax-1724]NIF51432.1 helix-turn-helix transcriptional regulator [Burkholderia sp. Ax-1724]
METWNKRLAQALEESDYTANRLAGIIGVSAPTVSAWIGSGKIAPAQDITANNLWRVCDLLNVRPEWVLYRRMPKVLRANSDQGLTAKKDASEADVYHDSLQTPNSVKDTTTADADQLKELIVQAVTGEGLSNELLNAIAWMIRAGSNTPVRGDQHHTKTVKLKHARPAPRKATGTG